MPAPPSTVALPPRQTSSDCGRCGQRREHQLAEAAARQRERVALVLGDEPAEADRLRRLDDRRPVRQEQPPRRDGRPSGSRDDRRAPLAAACPREHLGRPLAAVCDRALADLEARTRRSPVASAAAASTASQDALEASRARRARAGSPLRGRLGASSSSAGRIGGGHVLQHRVREPLAGEEDQPDPDADRGLDRLQPDPEREAARVRDAVLDERQRDRGLQQPDVARPEREDRRHVHQQQHEPGGRRAAGGCGRRASPCTRRAAGTSSRGSGRDRGRSAGTGSRITASP